jgi:hypothetical protein
MVENITNKLALGSSGSNIADLADPTLGALNRYLALGKGIIGERKETNPWLHAFQFFSNMAAEASKPGATALGAAGQAGTLLSTSLIKEQEAKRAEELAGAGLGVKLAATLGKPKKITLKFDEGEEVIYMSSADAKAAYPENLYGKFFEKFVPPAGSEGLIGKPILSTIGRPQLVKRKYEDGKLVGNASTFVPSTTAASQQKTTAGDVAIYMSHEDAKKYIVESLGIPEDHPDYKRTFNLIATNDIGKHGQSAIKGDTYIELRRRISGNNVVLGIVHTPSTGAGEPFSVGFRKEERKRISGNRTAYYDNLATVLPRIETVKTLLLSGAETGVWQTATARFKGLMSSAFGIDDPNLSAFETLQGASFYLATKMRPKGSGSTSDMEFRAYQKAGLSTENTPFANYISVYQMEKAIENGQLIDDTVLEMIEKGATAKEIREAIVEIDPGFYAKFEKTGLDRDDSEDVQDWWDSLDEGTVVLNRGDLFTGTGGIKLGMFIVKMPDGTVGSKVSGFGKSE